MADSLPPCRKVEWEEGGNGIMRRNEGNTHKIEEIQNIREEKNYFAKVREKTCICLSQIGGLRDERVRYMRRQTRVCFCFIFSFSQKFF